MVFFLLFLGAVAYLMSHYYLINFKNHLRNLRIDKRNVENNIWLNKWLWSNHGYLVHMYHMSITICLSLFCLRLIFLAIVSMIQFLFYWQYHTLSMSFVFYSLNIYFGDACSSLHFPRVLQKSILMSERAKI